MKSYWKDTPTQIVFDMRGRVIARLTLFIVTLEMVAATAADAQQPSIVSIGDTDLAGYGGPVFRGSAVDGEFTLYGGGSIEVVYDDRVILGIAAAMPEGGGNLTLRYGGIRAGYLLLFDSPVQFGLIALAGAGSATHEDEDAVQRAPVLVFEPEAMLTIDLIEGLRLGVGVSYRFAVNTDELAGHGSNELSFPAGVVVLQEGYFQPPSGTSTATNSWFISGYYASKFTLFDGRHIFLDGGGTRLFINEHLAFGISGYWPTVDSTQIDGRTFHAGYGGFTGEWVFAPYDIVHFSTGLLLAMGGGSLAEKQELPEASTGMFVIEPETYIAVNLTEFMRPALGLGYRFAIPLNDGELGFAELSGLSVTAQLRFGHF